MVKVRRMWGGVQWGGDFPIPEDPPPVWEPPWTEFISYAVGLIHPPGQWGHTVGIDDHEIVAGFDAYSIGFMTDCMVIIGLPANQYTEDDLAAWGAMAVARYHKWPWRLLKTCPGCRNGGHPLCPM